MTNFQVYKKTLSFSFVSFLIDLLVMALIAGLTYGGFLIFNSFNVNGVIGVAVGLFVGIVIAILVGFFVTNRIKAAQVAMMTKGVVDNKI